MNIPPRNFDIQRSRLIMLLVFLSSMISASADCDVEYHASVTAQASSKSLAPYMLGSWNNGRYAEGNGIWQEAGVLKPLDMSKRFSWSVGFDYLAGVGSKTDYDRWDAASQTWGISTAGRNAFRITRLFGELKFRAIYMTIGMKRYRSGILDESLSSGDLTRSNNATPIPGISGGFIDFVDIPFTKGWVQLDGEIMYGRMVDDGFIKREFNYYQGLESLNLWYNYKRCYFRTNPEKLFHVTVGMQAAAVFGGTTTSYRKGERFKVTDRGFHVKDALQMLFPIEGGEDYYTGNHVGSWDFKGTFRLNGGANISAYFQWPWEDGSGIGKLNGWDGLWGVQYDFGRKGFITKAVIEYLDFTNQSGPMHYNPANNPESPLTGVAEGGDNYYNNDYYGAYSYFGMSIGTPFLKSPIYNRSGMLSFLHNRARGFHMALEGDPSSRFSYRMMVGYELAGGAGRIPDFKRSHSTSGMIEGKFKLSRKIQGLELGLRAAFDAGSLRGDNFGTQLQLTYRGNFNCKFLSR